MTQQKLIDSVWEKFSDGDHLRYLAFCDAAKAYADARESKEIAELKAHISNNLLVIKGINENERQITEINSKLEAEIKRLRDALMWLKVNRTPDRAMIEVFIDKALSPAPVKETQNEDHHE